MFKQPLNLFLCPDLDQLIIKYIDKTWFSKNITKLPKHFIRSNIDNFDWDIISDLKLSFNFVKKYYEKINWKIYLESKHYKDVVILYNFKKKVIENLEWINKKIVYLPEFIDAFAKTKVINWDWYIKNKKIPEFIIQRYYKYMNYQLLVKHQHIPSDVLTIIKNKLSQSVIHSIKLEESFIEENKDNLNWDLIFTKQKLSMSFLEKWYNMSHISGDLIPLNHELTEKFILDNKEWLNLKIVCKYQNLSYDFIKNNEWLGPYIMYLQYNNYYNKKNSIQIFTNGSDWFIIKKYKNTSEYFNEIFYL